MAAILETENVTLRFGGLVAVDNVSISVPDRAVTGIVGPNGAGKTTLFNVVSGVLPADSGVVRFRGEAIQKRKPHQIALRGLARTFQDPRVFPELSALENVLIGMRLRAERPLWAALRDRHTNREWQMARERAAAMLDRVGLGKRIDFRAADLSYGQQRFVSIARALVSGPALVLMDEPTVGLDKGALERLLELMAGLVRDEGIALLVIEHNMDVIMSISERIVLLVQGAVATVGTPEEVHRHPSMMEAYLGKKHAARG